MKWGPCAGFMYAKTSQFTAHHIELGTQAALFFVSRRIASRMLEISDQKSSRAHVLSLRAEYTRSRVQKRH